MRVKLSAQCVTPWAGRAGSLRFEQTSQDTSCPADTQATPIHSIQSPHPGHATTSTSTGDPKSSLCLFLSMGSSKTQARGSLWAGNVAASADQQIPTLSEWWGGPLELATGILDPHPWPLPLLAPGRTCKWWKVRKDVSLWPSVTAANSLPWFQFPFPSLLVGGWRLFPILLVKAVLALPALSKPSLRMKEGQEGDLSRRPCQGKATGSPAHFPTGA